MNLFVENFAQRYQIVDYKEAARPGSPFMLAPDFAFVAKDRLPGPLPESYVPVVPDIVLETRSPNDTRQKVADKLA